jgi:hypothetical protein
MSCIRHSAVSVLLAIIARWQVFAQSYSIDWDAISGGGGTSSGGSFEVSDTIGQAAVGNATASGSYALADGFWSLLAGGGAFELETPELIITFDPQSSTVTVSWPSPSTGFLLQQTGNPTDPGGWSAYGGTVSDNGTTRSVTISPPVGVTFFRLKHQ